VERRSNARIVGADPTSNPSALGREVLDADEAYAVMCPPTSNPSTLGREAQVDERTIIRAYRLRPPILFVRRREIIAWRSAKASTCAPTSNTSALWCELAHPQDHDHARNAPNSNPSIRCAWRFGSWSSDLQSFYARSRVAYLHIPEIRLGSLRPPILLRSGARAPLAVSPSFQKQLQPPILLRSGASGALSDQRSRDLAPHITSAPNWLPETWHRNGGLETSR